MSDYNLLFIEKDKIYYDLATDYGSNTRFHHEHVKCGAEAEVQMDKIDIDIIVVNNDNEIDELTGETLAHKLHKKFEERKEFPFLIAYTSHVIAKNRWLEKFADAVFLTDAMENDALYSQINALLRRKEGLQNLSKENGLITRSDKKGPVKYFFDNDCFITTTVDSNLDKFLNYLLKHKGKLVDPMDISDLSTNYSRKNAAATAKTEILADVKSHLEKKYPEARKIFEENILIATHGNNNRYKYNNKFTISDFYRKSKALSLSKATEN